ncbi:MAG: A24 family peptidase [Planktomarina sp.]
MDIPAQFAGWAALATLPLCFFIIWEDLARLRIRNTSVVILFAIFCIVAPFTLHWSVILWHLGAMAITFAITLLMFELRLMGGGDAKLLTVMAGFCWAGDWNIILLLASSLFILSFLFHRLARALGAARITPNWESWHSKRRFPMGIPLALVLISYLALGTVT